MQQVVLARRVVLHLLQAVTTLTIADRNATVIGDYFSINQSKAVTNLL